MKQKAKQAILGFWVEPAYVGSRGCVHMHKLAYATLPKNTTSKPQSNLL